MKIFEGFSFVGCLIGIAGLAGAVELEQSPAPAVIITVISFIIIFICEKAEDRRRLKRYGRKNYKRIY